MKPIGDSVKALCLVIESTLISRFYGLLQTGFSVKALVGKSVSEFLCEQLQLLPEYVQARISTVFLDGKPVDDIDAAIIREGSTLALSSAMPGLVGATMRRKGVYASLRSTITYKEEGYRCAKEEGMFRVKLFNLLIAELGPLFLDRGIFVPSHELAESLVNEPESFWQGCSEIVFQGQHLGQSSFRETDWSTGSKWVCLSVKLAALVSRGLSGEK